MTTLKGLAAAPPQPVYEMRYTQTPASVAAAGSYASSQADKVALATVTFPRALIAAGILFLLVGTVMILRSGRRPQHLAPVVDHPTIEQHAA